MKILSSTDSGSAQYVIDSQVECGAISQKVDVPYKTNDIYGTLEAPIVYATGDPGTDLLYTVNFAFIGMHEAAAVTGNKRYEAVANKLAEFLVRCQIKSESHPELDGTWYRGFDYDKWEYWGSDGDAGWGLWTTETGWTHSWITTTFALRKMKTSLWDVITKVDIKEKFEQYCPQMLPDDCLVETLSQTKDPTK